MNTSSPAYALASDCCDLLSYVLRSVPATPLTEASVSQVMCLLFGSKSWWLATGMLAAARSCHWIAGELLMRSLLEHYIVLRYLFAREDKLQIGRRFVASEPEEKAHLQRVLDAHPVEGVDDPEQRERVFQAAQEAAEWAGIDRGTPWAQHPSLWGKTEWLAKFLEDGGDNAEAHLIRTAFLEWVVLSKRAHATALQPDHILDISDAGDFRATLAKPNDFLSRIRWLVLAVLMYTYDLAERVNKELGAGAGPQVDELHARHAEFWKLEDSQRWVESSPASPS